MSDYQRASTGPVSTGDQSTAKDRSPHNFGANSEVQSELEGAGDAAGEATLIKTKLTSFASDPPRTFVTRANGVLKAASPDARALLWEDEEFWAIPIFRESPDLADQLLRELDPVATLSATIHQGAVQGWQSDDILGEVQAWALEHGALCERALTSSRLLGTLSVRVVGDDKLAKVMELLIHQGSVPNDAVSRVRRALDERDQDVFVVAWDEATQDAAALKAFAADAAFLADVDEAFGETVSTIVQRTLILDASSVSQEDEDKLEGVISDTVRGLDELLDFFIHDATVMDALESMNTRVVELFPDATPIEVQGRQAYVRRSVVARLNGYIAGEYSGQNITTRLHGGLSASNYEKALAALEIPEGTPAIEGQSTNDAFLAKAEPLSRELAGSLQTEFDDLIVHDSVVMSLFRNAEQKMQGLALEVAGTDLAGALGMGRLGMRMVKSAYDEQYGSLVDAVHQGVQTDDIRANVLQMVGAQSDGADAVLQEAVANVDAAEAVDDRQAQLTALTRLEQQVRSSAELLDDACARQDHGDAKTAAGQVNGVKNGLVATTTTAVGTAMLQPSEVDTMFDRAFAAVGGSLAYRVVQSFPAVADAQAIFDTLGRDFDAARLIAGEEAEGLTDEQLVARTNLAVQVDEVFQLVESDAGAGSSRVLKRSLATFVERRTTYRESMGADAEDLYRVRNGIGLAQHLGLKVHRSIVRDDVSELIGEPVPALLDVRASEAAEADLDPDAIQFSPFAVGAQFTLEVARERAISIKEDIQNNKNTVLQIVQDGNKEELRVVIAVFEQIYGYNPIFSVKEAHADPSALGINDEEAALALERLGDAGQAGLGQRLLEMAQTGDTNAVYEVAFKAKADEKQEILADGELLAKLRGALDEAEWTRVWASLNGDLSLGGALRTREGFAFGLGSDDDGMKSDITMMGTADKATATADAQAQFGDAQTALTTQGQQPGLDEGEIEQIRAQLAEIKAQETAAVDTAFVHRCRGLWANLEVRAILERQLSGDDLLTMRQLILGGGVQSGTDLAWAEAESWGNATQILTHIKSMTDTEREAKRADPRFLTMVTRQLSGDNLAEAMSVLHAKQGEEGGSTIDRSLASTSLDEAAVFAAIASMSTAELIVFKADTQRVASIRGRLNAADLKRFDDTLAAVDALGTESLVPQTDADGVQETDWSEAAQEQERKRLILKHTLAIKDGAYRGADELMKASQAVYTEKGEITPIKGNPAKVELFTTAARLAVWDGVSADVRATYGASSELFSLVSDAVIKSADPSGARLAHALSGWWDNMDNAKEALQGVSEGELVQNWSNILHPGESGGSLKSHYDAYVAERTRVQALRQGGGEVPPEDQHRLDAMHYRYVDFGLDVSANLVDVLARRGEDAWPLEYMTARALLELKQLVRTKIVALPSIEIAKAIGVQGAEDLDELPADETLTEAQIEQRAQTQSDIASTNGTDRQARSMHGHLKELAEHQMTADSLADGFTYTDEQMSMYYSHYAGAYGEATEHGNESTPFGMIDAEEKAEIEARAARFQTSVTEYKAAKSKVAEVMKWVAIALITAASAAVTGPAGPSLIVALLTAGASATASVVIDEAVQGNDFDAGTEGIQKIVTDVGMAALTFGASKAWTAAAANYKLPGAIQSTIKTLTAQEKAIAEAAKGAGFVPEAMWAMGKAAVMVPMNDLSDAAVSAVDLSELKYGWRQGLTHADGTLRGALDGMGQNMRDEVVKALIDTGFSRLKEAVFPEETTPRGVDGAEEENPVPERRDGGQVLTDAVTETLSPRKLGEAAFDQAATTARGHLITLSNGKTVDLGAADGVSFLEAYVKGRVGGLIKQVGVEVGKESNNRAIAARAAELAENPAYSALPPDQQLTALRHYVHVLKRDATQLGLEVEGGSVSMAGFGPSPASFLSGTWTETQDKITANLPTRDVEGLGDAEAAYRTWVLEDPAKVEERLQQNYSLFATRLGAAQTRSETLLSSPDVGKLESAEAQRFFVVYASEPLRMMNMSTGEASTGVDISTEEGRVKFQQAVRVSKLSMGGSLMAQITVDSSNKEAFETFFKETGVDRIEFDPRNEAANLEALQSLYNARFPSSETQAQMQAFQRDILQGDA